MRIISKDPDGTIYMHRCPKCRKENYVFMVAKGICAWCGYNAHTQTYETTQSEIPPMAKTPDEESAANEEPL